MKSYKSVFLLCIFLLPLGQQLNAAPLVAISRNYLQLVDTLMIRFYQKSDFSRLTDFSELLKAGIFKDIDRIRQIYSVLLSREQPMPVAPQKLYDSSLRKLLESGACSSLGRFMVTSQAGGASVGSDVLIAQDISMENMQQSSDLKKELKELLIKAGQLFKETSAFVNMVTEHQLLDQYAQLMEQIENITKNSR